GAEGVGSGVRWGGPGGADPRGRPEGCRDRYCGTRQRGCGSSARSWHRLAVAVKVRRRRDRLATLAIAVLAVGVISAAVVDAITKSVGNRHPSAAKNTVAPVPDAPP